VAVGVAVVLAKATRERRTAPPPRRDRELGLRPGERAVEGLRRMALGQADLALELLAADNDAPSRRAVHDTRKAIKRLRALLRLLEHELGAARYAREDAALRDVGRRLSGARDAAVLLATLDALIERHPRKLAHRKDVRNLRRALLEERKRMDERTLGDATTRAQALSELRAFRARVTSWDLGDRGAAAPMHEGLERIYAQGRKRHRRAARAKQGDVLAMHRWRKRVKDLRYAAEMLRQTTQHPHSDGRGADARLRRVAKRADRLGEALGEDHDLAVLAQRVRANGKHGSGGRGGGARKSRRIKRSTRKLLLKLIAKRRRKLRRGALRDGGRLYRRKPERFAARIS
jgi:CHAD domain-containing protein